MIIMHSNGAKSEIFDTRESFCYYYDQRPSSGIIITLRWHLPFAALPLEKLTTKRNRCRLNKTVH